MPSSSAESRTIHSATRRCTKCKRELPLIDPGTRQPNFKWKTSTKWLKSGEKQVRHYQLRYCVDCLREQARNAPSRKDGRQKEYERRYRQNHRDEIQARQNEYRQSPEGKAMRKRANQRALPKQLEWKRKRRLEKRAHLPAAVVQPFVQRMAAELAPPQDSLDPYRHTGRNTSGYLQLAELTGLDDTTLRKIGKGERKQVPQATVECLAQHGDFTTQELVERSREWAMLTGDSWPDGYRRARRTRA